MTIITIFISYYFTKQKVADALLVIAFRNNTFPEKQHSLNIFEDEIFRYICNIITQRVSTPTEDSHKFVCKMGQMLCVTGLNMLELLNNNQLGSRKISYEPILQIMLSYLGHPSLIASLLVVKFWSSVFTSKKIGTVVQNFKQYVTQVVATVSTKLVMDKPTPVELGFIKYSFHIHITLTISFFPLTKTLFTNLSFICEPHTIE